MHNKHIESYFSSHTMKNVCVCVHLCESVDHSRELQWNQPNLHYKNLLSFLCFLAAVVLGKIVLKVQEKSLKTPFIIEILPPHPRGMSDIKQKSL